VPIFSHPPTTPHPVVVEGNTYFKSDWMDTGRDPGLSPTVYLVEQGPHISLRTHFHRNNQFQLFVRGDGVIGKHALRALTVHYAGAYSGYGPVVAGPQGLAYFTLRSVFETGSLTMVQHADQMKRGPKRQLHSEPVPVESETELAARTEPAVQDLIPFEADGVGARLYTLPTGTIQTGVDPTGSEGHFFVVIAGSMYVQERAVKDWGSVFVQAMEKPLIFVAGDGGVQVVCLQLPLKADQYR
jgi:hypothetical protein